MNAFKLLAAAGLMVSALGVTTAADAQPYHGNNHYDRGHHDDRGPRGGWHDNRGYHPNWRNHHDRCRTYWVHHHRVTRCY